MFVAVWRADDREVKTNSPAAPAVRRRRERGVVLAGPAELRQIMLLHGSGASPNTAAAALNGGGSRTTDGARWTAGTVAAVIANDARDAAPEPVAAREDSGPADRVRAIGDLGRAIAARQLELHYQPVVDMETGAVTSVEALVRWRHPERGLVPPEEFVPLAEACGMTTELTEFVVRTAIWQTEAWSAAGRPVRCAINLSASSLSDPRSGARLVALLRNRARFITVEVTEAVLADERAIGVLRELAGYGVGIAIDDFGRGYSCLASLIDLPASTLKIDQAFLCDIDADERAAAVVRAIVQLAGALGLDVVAEGIETEAVAAVLLAGGVRKAQGFLYARPMPADELDEWRSRDPRDS